MATKAEKDAAAKAEADKAAAAKEAADKAAAVAEAKAEADEVARKLAEEQRQAIAAGEDGQAQADRLKEIEADEAEKRDVRDATEGAQGHTITAPKDAPVDYAAQTLRRPPQRILPADQLSTDSMGSPPVVSLPYGSDARSIDPATGGNVKPQPEEGADVHGDDTDADVDAGNTAAMRAAKNA